MKDRRLYFRKKGKSIILEGRDNRNKPISIWTLPNANKFYSLILQNASFLTKEKVNKINEKVKRLAYKSETKTKHTPNIPLINIKRTQEKDAEEPTEEEILRSLGEVENEKEP